MAFVFQQLRSASASVKPGDLEPGQLAFNLADSKGYLGNGTNVKTLADGSTGAPSPSAGKGWLEFDLKAASIATLLMGGGTPAVIGDSRSFATPITPTSGQVLVWDGTANGGAGGYVPRTPGHTSVYSIANDDAQLNASSGSATGDLVAGLIATVASIAAKTDLHAGDTVVVTDNKRPDASANVGPGSYIYDGTNFVKLPGGGGGANHLGDLLNVNTTVTTVAAANQGGVVIRDTSVGSEAGANAYKVVTTIDAGTY